MNRIDLRALTLVGPAGISPVLDPLAVLCQVLDPLAVLRLINRLYITFIFSLRHVEVKTIHNFIFREASSLLMTPLVGDQVCWPSNICLNVKFNSYSLHNREYLCYFGADISNNYHLVDQPELNRHRLV